MMDERKSLQVPLDYAIRHATGWFEFAWRGRTAKKLFHSAASAGLMSIDAESIRFGHQLVQEYFAALSFIDASGEPRLAELNKRSAASWLNQMNTFIAICGLAKEPESLVRLSMSWGIHYAAQCLASGITVSRELRDAVIAGLIEVIRRRPLSAAASEEAKAADALGLIGDIDAAGTAALGDLLLQGNRRARESAATALSRLGTKAALIELRRAIGKVEIRDSSLTNHRLSPLADKLSSDFADDFMIDRLSEMGEIAVPELIETLDPTRAANDFAQRHPRDSAVRGLKRIGRPAVAALLQALRSGTSAAKAGSAEVLGHLKVIEAAPLLIDALASPESGYFPLHTACQSAFTAIGNAAIPHVEASLRSPSTTHRKAAVEAADAIGTAAGILLLFTALQDGAAEVRSAAGVRLTLIGTSVVDALLEFVKKSAQAGRSEAAVALGRIKDSRAVPLLQTLLTDRDDAMRSHAAYALGSMADVRATSSLLPLLQDTNLDVGESAAWALGQLKDVSAVDPLIHCLAGRSEEEVRKQAALSLEKIASQRALGAAMQYWRETLSLSFHAYEAGRALGRMKDGTAVPLLIEAMLKGPEFARTAYIEALGLIGDRSAVPAIIERLHDRDPSSSDVFSISTSAIEALNRLQDARAVEPLTALLTVTEASPQKPRICDLAAKALQHIGTSDAIVRAGEHWRKALTDAAVSARLQAAETLAGFRYEPATPQLIASLTDHEDSTYYDKRTVADFAAAALELIGTPDARDALRRYWLSELSSLRPRGRVFAIRGLGRIGDDESHQEFIPLLKDSYSFQDRYVADYAADVLKTSSSQEARVALAEYFAWRENRPSRWRPAILSD